MFLVFWVCEMSSVKVVNKGDQRERSNQIVPFLGETDLEPKFDLFAHLIMYVFIIYSYKKFSPVELFFQNGLEIGLFLLLEVLCVAL